MEHIRISNKKSFEFELTECDGSPVDLSEATVKFIVKKSKDDPDTSAILAKEIVNSETNNIMYQFDATETANLQEGKYVAALKIFKENNLNDEVWSDYVQIVKEVFSD